MDTVAVKRKELLEKLIENRNAHRAIFEDAMIGYRKKVIEELEKSIADAKANIRIRTSLNLVQPMDMTHEYDIAIGMLEMCVDEIIDIDDTQYRNFVMDDWTWKGQFLASSMSYSSSSSESPGV